MIILPARRCPRSPNTSPHDTIDTFKLLVTSSITEPANQIPKPMSLLDLQQKHPELYRQAFKRGALCQREISRPYRELEDGKPIFYGHPRHAKLIRHDLDLMCEVICG
jgi:hypothetical protein